MNSNMFLPIISLPRLIPNHLRILGVALRISNLSLIIKIPSDRELITDSSNLFCFISSD